MDSCSQSIPATATVPAKFARLYRAHVEPSDWRGTEVTAFVEASSHHTAVKKIAAAVAALEYRSPAAVEERIYNCHSSKDLIDEGLSESPELRIFETGWTGGKPSHFVSEPLFLLDRPADPVVGIDSRTGVTAMFIGTVLLFALCYVVTESWLEVDKAHRQVRREKQESERQAALDILSPAARNTLSRELDRTWDMTPAEIREYGRTRELPIRIARRFRTGV